MQQQYIASRLGHKNVNSLCNWENEKSMPGGTNLIKLCILYSKTPFELYPEYSRMVEQSFNDPAPDSDGNIPRHN